MFIWRADTILDAMERHAPDVCDAFRPLRDAIGTDGEQAAVEIAYRRSPHISIDYGVMERADNVFVVPGSFGWSDVGDWRAVYEHADKDAHGNALQGNVIMHDSSRSLVQAGDRLVVLVGVHDMVVVDTPDALLVGRREAMQQVKYVVEYLHAHQLEDYV
jgi:mannose-1-phosphate guanylyltransferase